MKLSVVLIFCSLVLGVSSQIWSSFLKEAAQGWLLWPALHSCMRTFRAESTCGMGSNFEHKYARHVDMREANYIGADKCFHTCGTYDAAKKGPGGVWAAEKISDAREDSQRVTNRFKHGDSGHRVEDSRDDQRANEWGWSGKDPNHFRRAGLPDKY